LPQQAHTRLDRLWEYVGRGPKFQRVHKLKSEKESWRDFSAQTGDQP
jgi:hypothetical protein